MSVGFHPADHLSRYKKGAAVNGPIATGLVPRGQHPCTRFMAIGHLNLVSHFLLSDCEGILRCWHCCRARQPCVNLLAHSGRAHRPMHQVLRGCFLSGPFQSALRLRASADARYGDNLRARARNVYAPPSPGNGGPHAYL